VLSAKNNQQELAFPPGDLFRLLIVGVPAQFPLIGRRSAVDRTVWETEQKHQKGPIQEGSPVEGKDVPHQRAA
jgi:hypothetical protein